MKVVVVRSLLRFKTIKAHGTNSQGRHNWCPLQAFVTLHSFIKVVNSHIDMSFTFISFKGSS